MGSFTNWRGISPENSLSRYSDNFFNNSFRRAWDSDLPVDRSGITVPAINVREDDVGFLLEFAAPGYKKSDFDIEVHNHVLTISAEREKATTSDSNGHPSPEEKNQRYTRREFYYQTFSRSFTLPENVEEDQIHANYQSGILSVEIPVKGNIKEQKSPRRISIG